MTFPNTRVLPDGPHGRVEGWPVSGRVSSPFGQLRDIYGTGTTRAHTGVDIAAASGTPVYSPDDGEVLDTFHVALTSSQPWIADWKRIFGNSIIIRHGGHVGLYAHLSAINVHEGQQVKAGAIIGAIGSTGQSTGPHLHWGWALASNRYFQTGQGLLDALEMAVRPPTVPRPLTRLDVLAWSEAYGKPTKPIGYDGDYEVHEIRIKRRK